MPGYTPKPTRKNEPTIITGRVIGKNGRRLSRCGTPSGYQRHLKANEWADDRCKNANAKAKARQRGLRHTGKRAEAPAPCGTIAAAHRHRARREPLDFPCRLAEAEAQRRYHRTAPRRIGPKGQPRDTGACGTPKGYRRHHAALELACGPCKAAHSARVQSYKRPAKTTERTAP